MYALFMILHLVIVVCLIAIILMQRGRSGGLVEALGGVESIFGTKTHSFMVRTTVVLAFLFFASSINLVYLSKQKGKSLLENYKETPLQKETSSTGSAAPVQPAVPPATTTSQPSDSAKSSQNTAPAQQTKEQSINVKPAKGPAEVAKPVNSTN